MAPASLPSTSNDAVRPGRLMFYFSLMYFSQGVCQIPTLLNQPIRAYLKDMGYGADQTSHFFLIAMIPWIIKPAYGLISDFIPLFGYRRRSYLLLLNFVAAIGFLWIAGMANLRVITIAAVLIGIGVAAADVIVDALMIEAGEKTGLTARFQSMQWIFLNAAVVLSSLISGALLYWCGASINALRIAAGICLLMPLVVAASTWWAVEEERTRLNIPELKASAAGLFEAFRSPRLIAIVAFLALLAANPGVTTPFNYHMTEVLHVSNSFAAMTDGLNGLGCIIGAVLFLMFLSKGVSMRRSLTVGILANAISMVPMLVARGPITAGLGLFVYGLGYQIGSLAMLTLAAKSCPKRAEGFVFATMMSVTNYSAQYSDVWGSQQYEGRFDHHIVPLIWISIALSLIALPIVPFLPLRREEEAEETPAEVAVIAA